MFCEYCGNKLRPNAKFCSVCGTVVIEKVITEDTGEIDEDIEFLKMQYEFLLNQKKEKEKLEEDIVQLKKEIMELFVNAKKEFLENDNFLNEESKMDEIQYCPKCGFYVGGERFCAKCGYEVRK